ncbi:hypothetical protein [Sphingopyxis granuli]|uniref:hypothetical protein n=1 Tax=Sphingopyxis granuli TaxID=267128 RepID=UPI001A9DA918|nr:hypothetical protein [Sphingopyxis granuli]
MNEKTTQRRREQHRADRQRRAALALVIGCSCEAHGTARRFRIKQSDLKFSFFADMTVTLRPRHLGNDRRTDRDDDLSAETDAFGYLQIRAIAGLVVLGRNLRARFQHQWRSHR